MLSAVEESALSACAGIVMAVLLAIVLLVATVSNTLVAVLFVRRRGMRTLPNRFVLNLAAVNLGSALVLAPLLLADVLLLVDSQQLCHLVDAVAAFVVCASVLATLLIAGDRYAAVTDALRYHVVVTRGRSLAAIAGCWLVAAAVAGSSVLVPPANKRWQSCPRHGLSSSPARWYAAVLSVTLFVVPVAALVAMYVRIYLCAHENSARQRRNSLGTSPAELAVPMMAAVRPGSRPQRTESLRVQSLRNSSNLIVSNLKHKISNASLFMYREEGRTAKVSLVVVFIFFACWLPFFLVQTVGSFVSFSPMLAHAAALLVVSNGAVSPFVYSFRSRRTQRELRRLCGLPVSRAVHAPRPLRRTLTNPTPFPPMDTIPPSPLENSQFSFPNRLTVPSESFLYALIRKSSSVPSINAAIVPGSPLADSQLFTFPPAARVEVTPVTCCLPRGSFSSDSSAESQASTRTDQTDASGH